MEYDIDKRGLALYEDKAKLFKMFWPSALGWVLIIPLIIASISKKRKLRSFPAIGIIAVFIWEALVMYPWQRLLFPKPILTIDDTGIAYSPIMPWYINLSMKIRWEEITKIHPIELSAGSKKRTRTLRCIGIFPKDADNFLQTLIIPKYLEKSAQKENSSKLFLLLIFPLIIARSPIIALMTRTKTPFMIAEQIVQPLSLNELLTYLGKQYQEELHANAIELSKDTK